MFTCIDGNLTLDDNIHLLTHGRLGTWIPVKQPPVWESSPDMHVILMVLKDWLPRTERFTGLLIAAVLGIIAVRATATAAGIALHQTERTTHFVQKWQETASKAWNPQSIIDQK